MLKERKAVIHESLKKSKSWINVAKQLIIKYGQAGLRTLDAVQLASALEVREAVNKYFTVIIL